MKNVISLTKNLPLLLALFCFGLVMMGADGCSSDPNVEGAKLDLRNKDYDRALVNLDKALEANPSNFEAHKLKGQVYQEMAGDEKDPTKHTELVQMMAESFNKTLELTPADNVAVRDDVTSRLRLAWYNEYQRGSAAYSASEYSKAIQYFNTASQLQPDSSATYVNLAYAHIASNNNSAAIEPLKMAIDKGDDSPDTYSILAGLYIDSDQNDEAISLLQKGREMYPNNQDLMNRLFNVYVATGQADKAIAIAKSEVDKDPENAQLHYNLGSLLLEAEQFEGAVEQLKVAGELDPEYTSAFFNLGATYQNKAVAINDKIREMEDKIREEGVSDEDKDKMQAEIDAMAKERDTMFAASIEPLENARTLTVAAGEDPAGVCSALGQAYVRVNDMEKAEEAYACAEEEGEANDDSSGDQ